jgi:hypothetical protein
VGERGNYNQVSFANTYVDAKFYIYLNDPKFIKEYKNKISKWVTIIIKQAKKHVGRLLKLYKNYNFVRYIFMVPL